jgi:hypothetical protein
MIRGIESNRLEGRRVIAAMLALLMFGVGVGQSGCFGSFKLTRKLYEVNKEASGNKFVRWLVFLGLTILPAYAGAMFVDVFIMNVIEFWSKGDPQVEVTAGDGPEHETIALEGGGTLHMERIEGGVRTRIVRGGETTSELAFRIEAGRLVALDAEGAMLGWARGDGEVVDVVTAEGRRTFESFPVLDHLYGTTPASASTRDRGS